MSSMFLNRSLKSISYVVLLAVLLQSFSFSQHAFAATSTSEKKNFDVWRVYDPNHDYTQPDSSNACQISLRKRGALTAVGYVTGLLPLWKTLRNRDRRNFVVFKQPAYGLVNTPVSVTLATILAWVPNSSLFSDHARSFPELFSSNTLENFMQAYFGYNITNIFRDAVTIDNTIPEKERYWLNIWYSVIVYSALTAGRDLARAHAAHNTGQYIFAFSLVTFAVLWPFFSRWMGMKITKFLFEGFPKDSELNIFNQAGADRQGIIDAKKQAVVRLAREIQQTKARVRDAESHFAQTQSGQDKSNIKAMKARMIRLKDSKRSTEKVIRRLENLRRGISADQPIPRSNRARMFLTSFAWSTAGAVMMTVIYFLSRWFLVGQSPSSGPSHPIQWLLTQGHDMLTTAPETTGPISFQDAGSQVDLGAPSPIMAQDLTAMNALAQEVQLEMDGAAPMPLNPEVEQRLLDMGEGLDQFMDQNLEDSSG